MHQADLALLALRVVFGVFLALHGYNKVWGGGKLAGTAGWFSDRGSRRQCLLRARRIHRRILVVSAVDPAGRRNMRLETVPRHVERAVVV